MSVKKIIKKLLGESNIIRIKNLAEKYSKTQQVEISKRQHFYEKFISKNNLCFDVGANIGNRITPLLNIGARVIAIEPQENCQNHLKIKFGNKIILVSKGLCEEESVRQFHINTTSSTISSFSDEWINSVKQERFKEENWDKIINVQMTTLDNLIKEYGVPTFIKIDVEGYELEVLKGLSKPVKMISIEYTVPEQSGRLEECIKTVENINPNILCNFSIGESMEWASEKWFSVPDFLEYVRTPEFIRSEFGDVYIKDNTNL